MYYSAVIAAPPGRGPRVGGIDAACPGDGPMRRFAGGLPREGGIPLLDLTRDGLGLIKLPTEELTGGPVGQHEPAQLLIGAGCVRLQKYCNNLFVIIRSYRTCPPDDDLTSCRTTSPLHHFLRGSRKLSSVARCNVHCHAAGNFRFRRTLLCCIGREQSWNWRAFGQ